MDYLKPPSNFNMNAGNLHQPWVEFKQQLTVYLIATEKDGKADKIKTSLLLSCMGKEAMKVYNTFTFVDEPEKWAYNTVIGKFDVYFNPKKSTTLMRYQFFTTRQQELESFDTYVTRLKTLAKDCELSTLENDLINDMIVIGSTDKGLQEQLLRKDNVTLADAVRAGQTAEVAKKNMGLFAEDEKQIDLVEGRNGLYHGRKVKSGNESNIINDCKYCSFTKEGARLTTKLVISGETRDILLVGAIPKKRVVKEILQEQASDNNGEDKFFIGAVDDHKHGNLADDKLEPFHVDMIDGDWNVDLNVSGSMINFKIDTGAQIDVLPHREYLKLHKRPKLVKPATKLKAYNGTPISVVGKCFVEVRHKGEVLQIPFIVADMQAAPILGLQTSSRFQLIKCIESVTRSMPIIISQIF